MKILIDLDSTLTNFAEVLLNELNLIHNTNYSYKEITHWNWFPETFSDPWEPTEHNFFWDMVEVSPQAKDVIEYLSFIGHEVYIVTASFFNNKLGYKINSTLKQLDNRLISEKNIIIAQNKEMVRGDVLIDDNCDNLINFVIKGDSKQRAICYAQPWNEDSIFYRTNDWNIILNHINNIY